MSKEEPQFTHRNRGVCAAAVQFDLDDENKVHNVNFIGGCNGNLKGISSLVEGMPAEWVIERCSGATCNAKSTSCPDQFAKALQEAIESK